MVTKIKLCFPDAPAEAVDKLVQGNAKKFDAFLEDASSPVKLFIFYQPRQFKKPELFLSLVGDGEKLTGKALYFLRNTNGKPVKTAISNDTTVLSGELNSELLQGFQSTVAQLYGPVLEKTDRWGHISRAEEKEVFLNQVSEFNDGDKLPHTRTIPSHPLILKVTPACAPSRRLCSPLHNPTPPQPRQHARPCKEDREPQG